MVCGWGWRALAQGAVRLYLIVFLPPYFSEHNPYFHHDSLSYLCDLLGLKCVLFEMEWSRKVKAVRNRRAFVI